MFNEVTKSVRVLSAAGVEKANSGHPGMPLGMADVGVVLYKNFIKTTTEKPDWINRDRFVLSAGHGSMLLYSLLHFSGFDISIDDIKNFRQLDSKTAGHPELEEKLGIDITTGPLGQGFATGVGLALAESYLSKIFGSDIIDHYVFGIVSDGDLMEGISYEAAELAANWQLGKLIYVFDDNNISIDGRVDKVSKTDQKLKFESLGWHVEEVNAHDELEILKAIENSKEETSKPSLVIAKSKIGKYSPNKEDTSSVHGSPLGKEEMELFLKNIKWDGDVFTHSSSIYEYFSTKREKDFQEYKNWLTALQKRRKETDFDSLWKKFDNYEIEPTELEKFENSATRVGGSKILELLGNKNKFILGGSADLAASTKQIISKKFYSPESLDGQSIEFGIREHAMAAVTNGINLHSKLFAYCSTFLVFSDYMRPSIRIASLMGLNTSFIFTHDSIYLGEDGPTHQPIEHLMSLRLIPGLDVVRPSNSVELNYSYRYLFSNTKSPKALCLTRQDSLFLDYEITYEEFIQGAFVISEGSDLTIFASGSEVELALSIKNELKEFSVQVVSAPILNKVNEGILEKLNLTENIFTIELGRSIGWNSYLKNVKESYSVDRFGESAPQDDLMEFFEFDVISISKKIRNYLN